MQGKAKQQGKPQGKAKAQGKTKQGMALGSKAGSKAKPQGKQQGQAKAQGKKQGKAPGSKATTKPGTAKPGSKASPALPPPDAGAAQATQAHSPKEQTAKSFPEHRHHFKTWFFQGRPGMVLSSIQIDIQAGAVHETWSRTG